MTGNHGMMDLHIVNIIKSCDNIMRNTQVLIFLIIFQMLLLGISFEGFSLQKKTLLF